MNDQKQEACCARHEELLSRSGLSEQSTNSECWVEPYSTDSCQFEDDDLMDMEPRTDGCYCSLNEADSEEMPLELDAQDNDYICPKCKDECVVRFALKLLGLTYDRDEDNK